MFLEQITSQGLAHHSYFLSSKGHAAVIDPRRDVEVYIDLAAKHHVKITSIFETHRNEDYLIGSLELAKIVDAEIYHGEALEFNYGTPVKKDDEFSLGSLQLKILDTPGHTPESISIVVNDSTISKVPLLIFTGDTLFAGSVGRTDLLGKDKQDHLSGLLYQSLHEIIMPLGDHIIVCPGHGAGSMCGESIGDIPFTTIGFEKQTNPALQINSKQEFISLKKQEQLYIPPYFSLMHSQNKLGPKPISILPPLQPLSVEDVKNHIRDGVQLVDIRDPTCFSSAHIPDSLNIWKNGLPSFAGWMLTHKKPIIVISGSSEQYDDVIRRLIRIGFENIAGYLHGGISSWEISGELFDSIEFWHAETLAQHVHDENLFVLDVRRESDWEQDGFIAGSTHMFVGFLPDQLDKIPKGKKIVVYCDSGKKTSIATSLLKKHGFDDVIALVGGMFAWKKQGYDVDYEKE